MLVGSIRLNEFYCNFESSFTEKIGIFFNTKPSEVSAMQIDTFQPVYLHKNYEKVCIFVKKDIYMNMLMIRC